MRYFTLLLLATSVCVGQPVPMAQRPQAAISPIPEALRAQLSLTREQMENLVYLHERYRQDTAGLAARLAELRAEQESAALTAKRPALRNQMPDNPELDDLSQRLQAAGDRYRAAVRGLLKDSQLAILDQLSQAAALKRVIEQARCFELLPATPLDEPAACGQYHREP